MKFISLLLALFISPCFAAWEFRGHHRVIGSEYLGSTGEYENESFYKQLAFNSRIMALYSAGEFSAEIAYAVFASYNRYEDQSLQSDLNESSFKYRLDDLPKFLGSYQLYERNSYQLLQNLDRLYFTYETPKARVKVGRQAIGFGSARTVNPLDILVPFNFVMINLEQKTGVDAARLSLNTGNLSELEFGSVLSSNLAGEDQFKYVSYSNSIASWDFVLILMSLYGHQIQGIDLQGSIGEIGAWLEGGNFSTEDGVNRQRLSVGGQYFFENELNLFVEYHFNGFGARSSDDYLKTEGQSYQSDFAIYLLGRNYVNLGGSYPIEPIKSLSLSIYNNLNDGSQLLAPAFEYNFSQDWYWTIGGFTGLGRKDKELAIMASEFGEYPRVLYTTLKRFF